MPVDKNSKLSIVKCIRFSMHDVELMAEMERHSIDVANFIKRAVKPIHSF